MAVEIPVSAFETVREIASDPAWYSYLFTGLGIGGPVGLAIAAGAYLLKKTITKSPAEGASIVLDAPFPRRLDEARALRQQSTAIEGRLPEYDAAVGRMIEQELNVYRSAKVPPEELQAVEEFWRRVRDRADKLMPPSVQGVLSVHPVQPNP